MLVTKLTLCSFALVLIALIVQSSGRSAQYPIHSDVVVTKWPEPKSNPREEVDDEKTPGWMRRQLMRFGEVTSQIGNAMGSHATKITSAIDKVCEIVKTVIPLLAAVCHVGQFKFCTATESAPGELSEALAPNGLDLDK